MIIKVIFLLFTMISLTNCASTQDPATSPPGSSSINLVQSDLSPQNGSPVFLGISARLLNRDDEVHEALLHIADQASRYLYISARYQVIMQSAGRTSETFSSINTDWDSDTAASLFDDIEILDIQVEADGTYVLAKVPTLPKVPTYSISWNMLSGEPSWVNQPPTIPGFTVAVGVTSRYRRFRDSVDFADQAAFQDLLLQSQSVIQSVSNIRDIGLGMTTDNISAQTATARVSGFLVIARYVPPGGQYVYSMVIARSIQ